MYIYIYVCVCVYIYIHTHIYEYIVPVVPRKAAAEVSTWSAETVSTIPDHTPRLTRAVEKGARKKHI